MNFMPKIRLTSRNKILPGSSQIQRQNGARLSRGLELAGGNSLLQQFPRALPHPQEVPARYKQEFSFPGTGAFHDRSAGRRRYTSAKDYPSRSPLRKNYNMASHSY